MTSTHCQYGISSNSTRHTTSYLNAQLLPQCLGKLIQQHRSSHAQVLLLIMVCQLQHKGQHPRPHVLCSNVPRNIHQRLACSQAHLWLLV